MFNDFVCLACYMETSLQLLQFSIIQVLTRLQETLSQINGHSQNHLGNNIMGTQRTNSPGLTISPWCLLLIRLRAGNHLVLQITSPGFSITTHFEKGPWAPSSAASWPCNISLVI